MQLVASPSTHLLKQCIVIAKVVVVPIAVEIVIGNVQTIAIDNVQIVAMTVAKTLVLVVAMEDVKLLVNILAQIVVRTISNNVHKLQNTNKKSFLPCCNSQNIAFIWVCFYIANRWMP